MSATSRSRRRVAATAATAGALALATALGAVVAGPATASSHREAPLIAADPTVDNTDLYAFVSPDKPDTVTFVANWFGLQEPNGGPTFYPWATDADYDINIDNDGNAKPDVSYRLSFTTDDRRGTDTFLYNNGPVTSLDDENLLFRQHYTLSVSKGGGWDKLIEGQVAPSQVGAASIPDYADAARPGDQGRAGRRQGLRRRGRGPVLRRPAGLRPALRRRPVRGRPGHAGRHQRQHLGAAGAAVRGHGQRRRRPQPGDRRLERHRAPLAAALAGQGDRDG